MPAVQLNRLKEQVNLLLGLFDHPQEFKPALNDLLEQYADLALRLGQALQKYGALPAHRTPPLVLQQLQQQLNPAVQARPVAALALADALWQDEYLEPKLLAVFILGQVPLEPTEAVTSRLLDWCQPGQERLLQQELVRQGSARLRREQPEVWLQMLRTWLETSAAGRQRIGLRALAALAQERGFENLPPLYTMILPLVQNPPVSLTADLEEALGALVKGSPVETLHLLRQVLAGAPPPSALRLIRRVLPVFEPEHQEALRRLL